MKNENDCLTQHPDRFVARHIGPRPDDIAAMLAALGHESLDAMIDAGTPSSIRRADRTPRRPKRDRGAPVAPQLGRRKSGLALVHW
ncbi:MAG: hypothetical protein HN707_04460, partial [Verrucomicrobia bacterium]|nr:hypothetical protein [Verrucomicrobiota bacterium]